MTKYLLAMLLGTALLILPEIAAMQTQAPSPCSVLPNLPCNGGGSSGLAGTVVNLIFSGTAKNTFGAFLALYFFVYGARLILLGEKSDIVDETKYAYAYGITGAAVYIFADSIIASVDGDINTGPAIGALESIIGFLNAVMGSLILVTITYQAFRVITKRGDEGAMDDLRKRFTFLITGIVVWVLANVIVAAAMPGSGTTRFVAEIAGVIRYILQIIGALAVLNFIFAGFLYVISVDEGQTDRAKKAMKNTVIALIVTAFSYLIVAFAANGFTL